MAGHGEKRSRRTQQAIAALLEHPTIPEAAAACGVSERTLRRWLALPEFQAAYREARRSLVDAAIARLQGLTVQATRTLERLLTCGVKAVECRAAEAILDRATIGADVAALLERLDLLERRNAENKARHPYWDRPETPVAGNGRGLGPPGDRAAADADGTVPGLDFAP